MNVANPQAIFSKSHTLPIPNHQCLPASRQENTLSLATRCMKQADTKRNKAVCPGTTATWRNRIPLPTNLKSYQHRPNPPTFLEHEKGTISKKRPLSAKMLLTFTITVTQ